MSEEMERGETEALVKDDSAKKDTTENLVKTEKKKTTTEQTGAEMLVVTGKKRKVLVIAIIALLVIVAIVLILVLGKKDKFRKVIVNDHSGVVELQRDQSDFDISKDMKLIPKDFVSVGAESLLDLLVDDDKHIAVRSLTKFSVDAVGSPKEGLVTINVTEGKAYFKIDNALQPEDGFQVVTPNATISVRGTTFTVDYNPSIGITRVECVEGKVNVVSNSGDEIDLLAGDVVEVIDTMTTSTLTQQEMDAIVHVFIVGDSEEESDSVTEEANADQGDGSEAENEETTSLICMTAEEIMQANVGDIVTYGTYGITYRNYEYKENGTILTETENGTILTETGKRSNPETPIEWIVLAKDGGSVTLLSKYVLDNIPYNHEYKPMTWENSEIRAWLNNDFYNIAFTETEKAHIQTTTCINEDNPYYGAAGGHGQDQPGEELYPAGGNTTQDKVYLLSLAEIEQYFGVTMGDWDSMASQDGGDWNSYGALCNEKAGGLLVAENPVQFGAWWWWLRSPGDNSYFAAFVHLGGGVHVSGNFVHSNGGVRPALKISL